MTLETFITTFLIMLAVICTWYIADDWRRNRHLPERQPLESADFTYLRVDGDSVEVRR